MYYLNKAAWVMLNPVTLGFVLLVLAIVFHRRARLFVSVALGWLLVWFLPITMRPLAHGLEAPYASQRSMRAEDAPTADAIVVLGGGVSYSRDLWLYPHLADSAARNWHAARLYKAGKAPYVIPTGTGAIKADARLIKALGVPDAAILEEDQARNTEENIKYTLKLLREKFPNEAKPRVLLVTSAWHMRRAVKLCARYAPDLEIIPIACDFRSRCEAPFDWNELVPSADAFYWNAMLYKEYLGILRYSL